MAAGDHVAGAGRLGDGQPGGSGLGGSGTALRSTAEIAELIKARVRDVADYPQPGVMFKDITPLLADGVALAAVISALSSGHDGVDKVAGIEARGFILAPSVALQLGAGFVPVRK